MRRKIVTEIRLNKVITVLLLSVAFITKFYAVKVPWYFGYMISCPLIPLFLVKHYYDRNYELRRLTRDVAVFTLLPNFVGLAYTFGLILTHNGGRVNPVLRAVSEVGQTAYILFLVAFIFIEFRETTIDILSEALVLSYLYSLLFAFKSVGVGGFVQYLSTVALYETGMNTWFEMHDIGLSVGMLLLCELFMRKKKNSLLIILLFIVMYLCHKRIAFMAFAVVCVLLLLMKKKSEKIKQLMINTIFIAVFIGCFIYIMLITTGLLYILAEKIGIDFSNRRALFESVKDLYEWSVFFHGNGLGFTGKYLSSIAETTYAYRHGSGAMALVHNDILKTYIDLGFVGSMLWFFWQNWIFPQAIAKRFGQKARFIYCLVIVYAYIIYMTDNTSRYFIFQIVFYSIVMCGCYKSGYTGIDKHTIANLIRNSE
ncbi:MAG: O-antigen ligase family protein [Clostridium sp.]|nr:O-antigen ligase family protein [Clostridium sp.]